MSIEAVLSNEFVVLALDAILHVSSVFVLGFVVIIACKLLSKGFVDAKLLTGLIIAGLLVAMRVFLLNNVHHVLDGVDILVIMIAVGLVLFLTSLVLVYKLISIPVLGTILSSIAIVAAQLALAHYTPVLSLKLMPEGQRFAEYAGVSNEKTKQLMAQAKNFQGDSRNNIGRVLKEALATLAFWSTEEEQETLSKDLSSGVRFIQERRAFMASMSEDELAEYRAAMSSFMKEQGVDLENRYSLENLKNATPEDLQNLASFMKDMNKEYGFTDDLPEGAEADDDTLPTLESLKQIAKNLKGIKIGGEGGEEFADLLKDMIDDDDFNDEMDKVRRQIADLKANSGQLIKTFHDADLEGMKREFESTADGSSQNSGLLFSFGGNATGRGERLFSQNGSSPVSTFNQSSQGFNSSPRQSIDRELMDLVIFQETGYYPISAPEEPSKRTTSQTNVSPQQGDGWQNNQNASGNADINQSNTSKFSNASNFSESVFPESETETNFPVAPSGPNTHVDYYVPVNAFSDFPEQIQNTNSTEPQRPTSPEVAIKNPQEDTSDHFPASELSNSLTDDFVLRVPKSADERTRWIKIANTISIAAWFEGTGGTNKGTVFIDGLAYRSGEIIEREFHGERYSFRFEGVEEGQVVITSLKRVRIETADAKNDQSSEDS